MLNLRLTRFEYTEESTIGILTINDIFEAFTLEDRTRTNSPKLYGRTAIPAGTYKITFRASSKFNGKLMPYLDNVPGFTGVMIHILNTAAESEGCIGVGKYRKNNFIGDSLKAFEALYEKLINAQEDIYITIIDTSEALK